MRILRLFCIILAEFLIPFVLNAGSLPSDFMHIEYMNLKREKNGLTSQTFRVACSGQGIDAIKVFYQVNQDDTIYQANVADSEFTISVDRPSFIHVSVVARVKQITYVAETDLALFGKSKIAPEWQVSDQKETELPFIELTWPKNNYWPQTGQTFKFHLNAPFDAGAADLFVFVNGRTRNLVSDGQSEFSYVPSHDLRLRRTGVLATRSDILFASISNGNCEYRLTYTLALHRSRQAFKNRTLGWAVFGSSFLFLCGLILIKRRQSPWWKESG